MYTVIINAVNGSYYKHITNVRPSTMYGFLTIKLSKNAQIEYNMANVVSVKIIDPEEKNEKD